LTKLSIELGVLLFETGLRHACAAVMCQMLIFTICVQYSWIWLDFHYKNY